MTSSPSIIPRRVFRDFFLGRARGDLIVAQLPFDKGVHIFAKTEDVKMTRTYAEKMLIKHRLTYEQLPLIQRAINEGFGFEGKNKDHLDIIYFPDRHAARPYILVLKSALFGREIWFVTLYRLRKEQHERIRTTQRQLWPTYSEAG